MIEAKLICPDCGSEDLVESTFYNDDRHQFLKYVCKHCSTLSKGEGKK